MAANPITVLAEGNKLLDELSKKLIGVNTNLVEISKSARGADLKEFFNAKSPNDVNEKLKLQKTIIEQLNAQVRERDRLEKALNNQIAKNKLAESDLNKELIKQRLETQLLNKKVKEAAILSSSLSTVYQKQSTILIQLRRKYKDVALSQGESSKEAQKLLTRITLLDARLKRVDANVGQFQRNVGNYGKAMRNAAAAARTLAGALGFSGGVFLFAQVMKDAIRTIREFDRQLIAVGKTTNISGKQLDAFGDSAIRLSLKLKGISINNLLKSAEVAGQLGITGTENILKFSETIEKLGLTSDLVGQESAQNFAKFIEVSSDSVENADRLGSVITDLGNNFATTEGQILKNTTEIQKGISIYNTTAQSVIGLGAATNALGSQAEASRGALQTTFKVLSNAAVTGKNLEQILELTGQTAAEFRREFATNSIETFRKFVKGLSESEKAGKNLSRTLIELNLDEKRTEAVVGSLAKNYNVLEEALQRANEEYKNNTALNIEAAVAAESLDAKINDVVDSWDGFVLGLEDGNNALGRLIKIGLEGFAEGLDKASLAFQDGISTGDKYRLMLNNMSRSFSILLPWVEDGTGLFQESTDKLLADTRAREENRAAIQDQITSFIELNGSLAPFLEGKDADTEFDFSLTGSGKGEGKKVIEEEARSVLFLQGKIKELKEEQEGLTLSDKQRSKEITKLIDKYQEEINAILGVNKARQKGIQAIKGSLAFIKSKIKLLEEKRDKLSKNSEEYKNYTDKINEATASLHRLEDTLKGVKRELADAGLGAGVDEFDTEKAVKSYEDYQKKLQESKIIFGIETSGLSDLEDDLRKAQEIELDIARETADLRTQIEQDVASSIKDITGSIFDAKIMRYEEDIQRNNDYYANLLDNENLSENQRDAIEAERERKNAEIEKKKRATQRKAAIFAKLIALTEVAVDTAKKVSAISATAAVLAANPITAPLATNALAQIPLVLGSAALAVATIAARPIPQLKDGKKKGEGKDTIALLNDGGKDELKISESGKMERITGRNVLGYVKKSDTIIPDADKFLSNLSDQELFDNLHKHTILSSISHQKNTIDSYLIAQSINKSQEKQTNRMIKAMEKNRAKINVHNNVTSSVSDDLEYIFRKQNSL